MKKRIFCIMIVICLMLGLMTTAVFAEGGTVKTVATDQELLAALADSANDTVKLTADINLSDTLSIIRTVTLDLNGFVLGRFYAGDGPVIRVESGGSLTLIDSDPTVEHKFANHGKKLWKLGEYGTNIVSGGVITGDPFYTESGVYVQKGGTFIMKGGNIAGCYATLFGGGVFNTGSFTMEDGNIMGCLTEGRGGAVYACDGTFTMTGGKIDNCGAGLYGDGIYLSGPAVMYANGGEVNENVFLETNSQITTGTSPNGATAFRKSVDNTGTIGHGMFYGEVSNSGTISGGTFSDRVTNTGVISGGTFADTGTVANKIGSTVSGGTFNGTVTVEVVINADNGSDNITQEIPRGQKVSKPDDPQKTDHSFIGWYNGNTAFDFNKPVFDAVMIKARWVEGTPPPRLRINAESNEWEVSYDEGYTWLSLGVKATGTDGNDGTNGTDGKDGKDGIDGQNGQDGKDGTDGQDGKDGTTPQLKIGDDNLWYVSYDGGQTWISLGVKATGTDGKDGTNGTDGQDGKDGIDGQNGQDGKDGTDGQDGKDGTTPQLKIGDDNLWYVSYDGGQTWTSLGVKATGDKGDKGEKGDKGDSGNDGNNGRDGVSVSAVTVDKDGNITITFTDGSTHKAGSVPVTKEEVQALKTTTGVAVGVAGVSLVGMLSGIGYALLKRKKLF